MSKAVKVLGIVILIVGITVFQAMNYLTFPTSLQVPYHRQESYQEEVTQTQLLDHRENYQIQSGHYAYSKFDLEAGKKLVMTWQVDNTVSTYITTPSQFSSASLLGFPTSSLAREVAVQSGTLSYQISSSGTYYVIIRPYISDVNVAAYKSELQWQETVTKYRTVTDYKTEVVYNTSSQGISLGFNVIILGSIVTALGFVNYTKLFNTVRTMFVKTKNRNLWTCEYCASRFNKTIDKCPNCGARRIRN